LARKQSKSSRTDSYKKKTWYSIAAPEMFGTHDIGATLADEPEKLIGRSVSTTVGQLTNDFSKQNIKLHFKISEVTAGAARTKFVGHQLTRDYIGSLVRRDSSRIDGNIEVVTRDGYRIRVKPTCMTINRAKASQVKAIRKSMIDVVSKRARKLDFARFTEEVVLGKLSAKIYRNTKNIYPLKRVEILKTEVNSEPNA